MTLLAILTFAYLAIYKTISMYQPSCKRTSLSPPQQAELFFKSQLHTH